MALGNPLVRALVVVGVVGGCASDRGGPEPAPAPAMDTAVAKDAPGAPAVLRPSEPLAHVSLPARADLPATIEDRATHLRATFALLSARAVAGTASESKIEFHAAGPGKSNVRFHTSARGVEDFVEFATRPASEEVRYRVDVGAAAGLRLVENVLELLDRAGAPRLRMAAPYVLDTNGRHDVRVTLEDCAADRDPAGPWGRPVTSPGRADCVVRIGWGDGGDGADPIAYPAVLDPKWTATTGTMTRARRGHTATLLASGKVLVAGGESTAGATTTFEKTAELFDPTTNTFAATGSMTDGRSFHGAALLSTGNVVVAGGSGTSGVLGSSEVYDPTTAKFHAVAGLVASRSAAGLVALGTGHALIAGGLDGTGKVLDSSELFDGTAEQWSTSDRLVNARIGGYLTTVPTGEAIFVAGTATTALGDLAACERYSTANKWASITGLATPRHDFAGAMFADGKILVAGGYQASVGKVLATAELLGTSETAWVAAGSLKQARTLHTLTALPSGAAVAAGGLLKDTAGKITSYLKSAELFNPALSTWSALADMTEARSSHTATLLVDGRVLVAGGESAAGQSDTAELLAFDATGVACTTGATCASGFCADGFCCKTVCDTTCSACALAATGKPNGTCGPVAAGKDPRNDCTDDGAPACGKDGLCDGTGACESYAATACTPKACTAGTDCTSGSCADGICCDTACDGPCEACTAAKKGSGSDGTCGPVKAATDPDADCGKMGTGTCAGDGTCDGAGACRVPNAGKACAAAACVDAETLGAPATCSAAGDCTPATTSCAPFRCVTATAKCATSCTADADCATGAHCKGAVCARSVNGATCAKTTDCASGICTDGVCCDTACSGQCEACDVAGSEGTCKPVTDPPHGTRAACDGTAPCKGHCNGLLTTGCVYPAGDTSCGTNAACSAGTSTADRCNASGACVPTPVACGAYGCADGGCATSCTTSSDCASGFVCSSGACVVPSTRSCADGGTKSEDGGACQPPASGNSGGCGCRTAARTTIAPLPSVALVLLGFVLGSRRAMRRRASTSTRRA